MNVELANSICKPDMSRLVVKCGTRFFPLIRPEDIDRDLFFHLRSQLITLGCAQGEVIDVAKAICMELLQLDSEQAYLEYVYDDTFRKCKELLTNGYDPFPIQNISKPTYSHINLFSSIYGFEFDCLRTRGIKKRIADIGCGDGLLSQLASTFGLEIDSYDLKKPIFENSGTIRLIEDFYDIDRPYDCLIYNHVLEHVQLRPDYYLRLVMNHFLEKFGTHSLKLVLISLPMHVHIPSHLASHHQWVCSDKCEISNEFRVELRQNRLKLFNPAEAFGRLANDLGFRMFYNNKIGVYVFERS